MSDMEREAVSHWETAAAECRLHAAKFKRKSEQARLPVKKAFFSGLERRYLLLAEVNEKEAQRLRAKQGAQTSAVEPTHEEAARCRQRAADAKHIAAEGADPLQRQHFVEIERHWLSLAKAYDELGGLEPIHSVRSAHELGDDNQNAPVEPCFDRGLAPLTQSVHPSDVGRGDRTDHSAFQRQRKRHGYLRETWILLLHLKHNLRESNAEVAKSRAAIAESYALLRREAQSKLRPPASKTEPPPLAPEASFFNANSLIRGTRKPPCG